MVEASLVNLAELGVLVIGVIITLRQLNDIKQTREEELESMQTQLQMQILDKTRTMEYVKHAVEFAYNQNFQDYDEWIEKFGPRTNPEAYMQYIHITELIQNLGLLVKRNVIDADTLSRQLRPRSIIYAWEKIEPIVKYHRENINPAAYEEFEYLANEMRTLLEGRKAQSETPVE